MRTQRFLILAVVLLLLAVAATADAHVNGRTTVVKSPPPDTGVKVSPDGSVIAVVVMNGSNRPKESPFYNDGGKLLLLRATRTSLSRVAEAPIGHWPQGAAFSANGKTILVGNMVEKDYWVFQWDGTTLRDTGQRIKMKGGPGAIRIADK